MDDKLAREIFGIENPSQELDDFIGKYLNSVPPIDMQILNYLKELRYYRANNQSALLKDAYCKINELQSRITDGIEITQEKDKRIKSLEKIIEQLTN